MKHFSLILILILFFFSCQNEKSSLLSEHNLIELNKLLEANNKNSHNRSDFIFRSIEEEKTYPEKFRYSFIYQIIERTIREYQQFFSIKKNLISSYKLGKDKTMTKQSVYNTLLKDLKRRDSLMLSISTENIKKNYYNIGLKENEYESYIAAIERQFNELNLSLKFSSEEEFENELIFEFALNSLEASAHQKTNLFIRSNHQLIGSRSRLHKTRFPIIFPKSNCLKKGDYFKAEIGIGHYYSFDFDNVDLIVNGDTLEFSKNKVTADYEMKVDSSGTYQLEMKANLHAPNGETYVGHSSYEFNVN